jgi:hypothetical protein
MWVMVGKALSRVLRKRLLENFRYFTREGLLEGIKGLIFDI